MFLLFYGYSRFKSPRWEAKLDIHDQEPEDPDDPKVRKFETVEHAVDFQEKNYHIAPEFWEIITEDQAREIYKEWKSTNKD